MRTLAVLPVLAALVAVAAPAQSPAHAAPPQLNWGPAPPALPPGARLAVLQGDPSQPALFTIRLEFPDGYKVAPHFHPNDEVVTVVEGTFLIGMGDVADFTRAMTLPRGAFGVAAAGQHHFAMAKGRTVIQIHGVGPFALTYVNPADDPQRAAKAQ